ncbi:helix-turn-helix transcriptional regulator [Winogradskya humida]|uniref:HTH cro/C1-type domain-containing protein n=1 Tax=Winogradskya humida TaxID=113566 RepID=A0ABQ4A731_9ACTN|nr:helix-turn-helix transcriptional regulator [Actinoplanes humidus]GIE26667.1 hypothetical protein Ahu01nite_097690 [Actinoplanes humidus]
MGERRRGVAYRLWLEVEKRRAAQQMSKVDLAKFTGLNRTTIDGLETSRRRPSSRVVHAYADLFGIPRDEAEELAGIVPPQQDMDVRSAISESTVYTDAQKKILLSVIEEFEQASAQRIEQVFENTEESAR